MPYKIRLDNKFTEPVILSQKNKEDEDEFDRIVRNFEIFNCNTQIGIYAAFYVKMVDTE